ncbi:MAG TPA: Uma2 family endonuclease [Polyangiaceae bacterium]
MAGPLAGVRLTLEEAARLDPDEFAGELEGGVFVPMTKGTWRHGVITGNVYAALRAYARKNSDFSVSVGDPGTKLSRDPDTLRGPDVAIVRTERVPRGRGASGWLEGAPDVAVEVVGDAQSVSELTKKALEYLAAGAKAVWVIDPEPRHVVIFAPNEQVRVVGPGDVVDAPEALPGFACSVDELFE